MKNESLFKELGQEGQKDLFGETLVAQEKRAGRNADMLEQRNKRLAARLYYYRRWHTMVIQEYVYRLLMLEFDLTLSTLSQLLPHLQDEMRRLKATKPELKELRSEYFWMVWTDKDIPELRSLKL